MTHFTELQAIAALRPDGGVTMRRIPIAASEDCYTPRSAANMGLTLAEGIWSRDLTDVLIVADLKKAGIEWQEWHRVDEASLPDDLKNSDAPRDPLFRNSRTIVDGAITTNMDKARAIYRDQLRAERAPLLAALDVEYQQADETSDKAKKAEVAAKKQALRDVTKDASIEAAQTPEELKAIRPAALLKAIGADPVVAKAASQPSGR